MTWKAKAVAGLILLVLLLLAGLQYQSMSNELEKAKTELTTLEDTLNKLEQSLEIQISETKSKELETEAWRKIAEEMISIQQVYQEELNEIRIAIEKADKKLPKPTAKPLTDLESSTRSEARIKTLWGAYCELPNSNCVGDSVK